VINTCISKMSNQILKAAILVVSTTASKDPSADSSGAILKDVFDQEGGGKWEVTETKIVGDVVLDIQRGIMGWTDGEDAVNLIISTGGTGFAVHDNTPEVCNPSQIFGRKYSLDLRPSRLCCTNMPPDLYMEC
jgi:molybdopterin biosynthesis enzyme MoaB